MSSANGIKVVARFRPQNKVELASGGTPIVSFDGDETCVLDVCCPFALLEEATYGETSWLTYSTVQGGAR